MNVSRPRSTARTRPSYADLQRRDPFAPRNIARQSRHAVHRAVEHVELVRDLVRDDVEAVERLCEIGRDIGP